MRDFMEKVRNKNIVLLGKVLFIALVVFLLLLLSERKPAREASVAAEERNETESETEEMSEGQSERLTPAELAMLEDEGTAAGDGRSGGSENSQGAEGSVGEIPVLLEKMRQFPADFRIPMTMPEQKSETSTRPGTEKAEQGEAGEEELSTAQPAQKEENAKKQIVEYQDGLSFGQWRIANEIYKISLGGKRSFDLLKKMVENRIEGYDGDWSVYVKDLETDESFVVNDRPMKSASVMKLFILGTVYKAIEAGELERTDEVVSLMNSMITASDNEASNRLLYLLGNSSYRDGIAKVDAFIQEYGFSEMTVEYNGFNDEDTVLDSGHNNQVSAKDCGKLLEDIYHRIWVNRSAANEIEQMLLNQQTRYKIPAGLPDGVSCGNKTGEMDTTENDAAVVYGKDCDYILVVLSSDWSSKDQAISRIASMSEMVYRFLN